MVFPQVFIPFLGILCLFFLITNIYSGYRDGFVMKGCELLSTLFCVMIAWSLSDVLSVHFPLLREHFTMFGNEALDQSMYLFMNRLLLFLVLTILLRIALLLVRPLFKAINWIPFIGFLNRLAGAGLGILQGGIMIILLVFVLNSPLFVNGEMALKESGLNQVKEKMDLLLDGDTLYKQMESLQKLLVNQNQMMEDDYNQVRKWLQSQGFNENEQAEIIVILKDRNE